MALVSDLIDLAFSHLGDFVYGEGLAPGEQATAFLLLNQMIASWSLEKDSVYTYQSASLNTNLGNVAYTAGVGGSLNTAQRPSRLLSWRATSGGFTAGGTVLPIEQFDAQAQDGKGTAALLPSLVGADTASPLLNIRVLPPPAGVASIEFFFWLPLPQFATVNDVVNLPPGYEAALHYNLAVMLYPQYAKVAGMDAVLAANAQNYKAAIVGVNSPMNQQQVAA